MIDLHSHILPGVDDGADDLEQSIRMCEIAYRDGCRAMVATPHLRHERYGNDDRRRLEQIHRRLCEQVSRRLGTSFKVFLGGEIAINSESLAEMDELPRGQLLPMAGSRYLLLELSIHGLGPDPVEMVYELGLADWRPIIAHPERIAWLVANPGLMAAMIDHGALFQITGMSLTGAFGPVIREAAELLMDNGWVRFVSSDAHDERIRPPGLSSARRLVAHQWGNDVAVALFQSNPQAVLEDRALDPAPEAPARRDSGAKPRGLVDRLKRLAAR